MPKKKKHPRLPNGYGQIRYVGKGRRLPYAVHPPATDRDELGRYIRPKALCYVPDWYTGFAVLSAYKNGTYKPGLEIDLQYDRQDVDAFIAKVLTQTQYQAYTSTTLQQVYDLFIDWKFGENAPKKLSASAKLNYIQGWKYLKVFAARPIDSIHLDELQKVVTDCEYSKGTRANIVLTAKQLWKYAISREMCEKDVAQYVVIPNGRESEHGVPFTESDLVILWAHTDLQIVRTILVMCYSGYRVGALQGLEINKTDWYFRGGVKTAAGKNRIVPIHSAIRDLVPDDFPDSVPVIRRGMYAALDRLGIERHTPHDCRHTFSMLCEKYGVNDADRKRLMGHSFAGDITSGVYGHRSLEDLRAEIEKIRLPETSVGLCGD